MFFEPSSRLYWPFLLASACAAWIYLGKLPSKQTLKKYLRHSSTHTDIALMLTNIMLKLTLFSVLVGSAAAMALPIVKVLRWVGITKMDLGLSPVASKVALTFFAFILSDFLRFVHHYFMHQYAWFLHKVHHSAKLLTPLTLFRTHPLEAFLAHARNIFTYALTLIVMMLFFNEQLTGYDFLGVNLFGLVFNAAFSNLRHSPIPISFGIFEYIMISPRMHQVHHSQDPKHFNKNYGVALSLWDQLIGSFYRPSQKECESMIFGLSERPSTYGLAKKYVPA